jgi:hypothetical protein
MRRSMGSDVRRSYFPVEVNFIDHDKWARLQWAERGKWLAVRALAERQAIRGTFPDRGYLVRLLKKEGDDSPDWTVENLIAVRLLDEDEEGVVQIHDREEWSASSTPRVRAFRERNRGNVDNTVETVDNVTKQDETFHETEERFGNNETDEKRREEKRVEEPPTPLRRGHERGSRANGTNPRSVAAKAREERKRQKNAAHMAYLRGELSEGQLRDRYSEIDSQAVTVS